MTVDEDRARVLELFDRVVNAHDPEAIHRFTGDADIEGTFRSLLEAFPDLHFEVGWTAAEGDRVVASVEMRGTHEGPWLKVREPTHRPVRASLLLAFRFDDDGMMCDTRLDVDALAVLGQLGWGVAPVGATVPDPGS
jgi:predicted ester cyclase